VGGALPRPQSRPYHYGYERSLRPCIALAQRTPATSPHSETGSPLASIARVTTETIQVGGVRCERCVMRLGAALEGHEGLEAATANLLGEVTLTWDDERTSREELVAVMSKAGFAPA
jgi:copper chaperone CopZ